MNIFRKKCPNPFTDKVKCDECKCWLDKDDAYMVEDVIPSPSFYSTYGYSIILYYCNTHKKPYIKTKGTDKWAMIKVDDNGEPIVYKKVK